MDFDTLPARLRALIGTRLRVRGQSCRIIDVLEPELALVLQCDSGASVIQPNQYGDATRRVPRTLQLPVLTPEGNDLHPDFRELGLPLD